MKVTPIAYTSIDWHNLGTLFEGTRFYDEAVKDGDTSDADILGEFAGRACYKAFNRGRPETATTETYLANILTQGHYSVLEHASVTFHVQGVSRALLVELERHRFLSFSVESQRYVDQASSHEHPVIPPILRDTEEEHRLRFVYSMLTSKYRRAVGTLRNQGVPVKQAREAARAYLPNCTPVDLVVTGNLRCWRDVLGKRYHEAADAEIREFAAEVLRHLQAIAPYSVQDIPEVPYGKAA